MSVAFIITNKSEFNISHYNNQETGRAKAFIKYGYDVDIYVYSKEKKGVTVYHEEDKRVIRIIYYSGLRFLGNQTIPLNLKNQLAKHSYQFVYLHEYPWLLPFLVARYYKKSKTKVFLMQGVYYDFKSRIKRIYNWLYDLTLGKRFVANLDGIIFKTVGAREYFRMKGYLTCKNTVIPIGLDTSRFENENYMPLDCKTREYILSFKKKQLFIGTLERVKNPLFLVDLLKVLVKKSKDNLLIVVGKGSMRDEILNAIRINNLGENFLYIESLKQEELPWLYKNSDVFLLPSSSEIFGMVLMEALYFNLPIISTPTAGGVEVLRGIEGTYVEDLDVKKWSHHIQNVMSDIGAKSKVNFPKRLDWGNIVNSIIPFCKE